MADSSMGLHAGHDAESVTLYLEESVTFRAISPEAAISLAHPAEKPTARARRR